MIKKLLLTLSFIILATIAFNGTTYAAQTGEIIVITEEISKLNKLYKEGFITEEEFSSAKSILLNPDSGTTKEELSTLNKLYKEGFITEEEFSKAKSILLNPDSGTTKKEEKKWWQWPDKEMEEKKKAVILKKQKLTAVERRDLEELEKEDLKAAKKAERERKLDEEVEIERACEKDPQSKECRSVKGLLKKLKIISSATSKKEKKERELEKQASLEEQKRIKAEKAAAKRAEVAAKKAEKKRLKAERKKACLEDPESKACKEGKRKKFLIF